MNARRVVKENPVPAGVEGQPEERGFADNYRNSSENSFKQELFPDSDNKFTVLYLAVRLSLLCMTAGFWYKW